MNMDGFESQSNDLTQSFAPAGDGTSAQNYKHPLNDEILHEAFALLEQTDLGSYMLQVMRAYNIPVRVIKAKEVTYTSPDELSVVLMAPVNYKADLPIIAMSLYCGIRDVEQALCGFRRPDAKTMDAVTYSNALFSKSFDIVIHMFRIADELNQKFGLKKVIDKIVELGHSDLYEAYKAGSDFYALQNLYLDKEYETVN